MTRLIEYHDIDLSHTGAVLGRYCHHHLAEGRKEIFKLFTRLWSGDGLDTNEDLCIGDITTPFNKLSERHEVWYPSSLVSRWDLVGILSVCRVMYNETACSVPLWEDIRKEGRIGDRNRARRL